MMRRRGESGWVGGLIGYVKRGCGEGGLAEGTSTRYAERLC